MVAYIILAAIVVGGILIDQLTKAIVVANMTINESIPIIKDFFHITYITNDGMAFGLADDSRWVFMVFSTIAILGIGVYLFGFCKERMLLKVGLALIVSGGIGNMIDRIFRYDPIYDCGVVVDMIDFKGIWQFIFNVADALVCVGAGIVILALILDVIKEQREKKEKSQKNSEKSTQGGKKEKKSTQNSENKKAPLDSKEAKKNDNK